MKVKLGALRATLMDLASLGLEVVGFLLGSRSGDHIDVKALYRVDNELGSPVEFRANPWQTVQAHNVANLYQLEVVALYHTHPSCPPTPSLLDLRGMRLWPIPWVIACRDDVKAWTLEEDGVREVEIE